MSTGSAVTKFCIIVSFIFFLLSSSTVFSQTFLTKEFLESPNDVINKIVHNGKPFYGFASYFNNIEYLIIYKDGKRDKLVNNLVTMTTSNKLRVRSRYSELIVKAPGLKIMLNNNALVVDNSSLHNLLITNEVEIILSDKRFTESWLDYNNILSTFVYTSIIYIYSNIVNIWGLSIILFSLLIRILLLPVDILQKKSSDEVALIKYNLTPLIADIKKNDSGEVAHNKIIKIFEHNNISQLYKIKPVLYVIIQIPILIVIFNVIGSMKEFQDIPFLWISDLSYPDYLVNFNYTIPFVGNGVHLLPIVLLAQLFLSVPSVGKKHILYFFVFLLIYPLPSVLLLYLIFNILFKEYAFIHFYNTHNKLLCFLRKYKS